MSIYCCIKYYKFIIYYKNKFLDYLYYNDDDINDTDIYNEDELDLLIDHPFKESQEVIFYKT